MPLLPAFEGDITCEKTGNALRTILHFNYISICRDGNSIFKQIEACGINPNNYISVCSLRQKGELLGNNVLWTCPPGPLYCQVEYLKKNQTFT